MGHRDACVRGGRERGRDARDDLEGDAGLRQRECLLAASAEEEGVAALKTQDQGPGLCPVNQDAVDLVLGDGRVWPRDFPTSTSSAYSEALSSSLESTSRS